mgnify:FL=1
MKKIIQIIPAVTNLYAIWKEDNDKGKEYGVGRAYYLGLDDNGEVYPLVIDGDGYIDTFNYDDSMVFDYDSYQWWKRHVAELPVNEYFNMFEKEQREKGVEFAESLFNKKGEQNGSSKS